MNKHTAYTLWMKWKNTGWMPAITAKHTGHRLGRSPYSFLKNYAERVYDSPYFKDGPGKWIIKPEGQKPAELLRKEAE